MVKGSNLSSMKRSSLFFASALLPFNLGVLAAPLHTAVQDNGMEQIVEQLETKAEYKISDNLLSRIEHALEANPSNNVAHTALALCYDRLGLPDLANREFEIGSTDAPDDPTALLKLIRTKVHQGENKSATALLKLAYRKFPKNAEIMFWYGNYLRSCDKNSEASELFARAKTTNQTILGLGSALAETSLERGLFEEAIRDSDQDLKLDKSFPLANELKATALASLCRYDQAIKLFSVAYAQAPFRPGLSEKYAYACYWNGLYRQALEPALVSLALSSYSAANNLPAKTLLLEIIPRLPKTTAAQIITGANHKMDRAFRAANYHTAVGDVLDVVGMHDQAIEQYQVAVSMQPNSAGG